MSVDNVKQCTNTVQLSHLGLEEFWNDNPAESLVITLPNIVPEALLTFGNVPGFPSSAQNKTTENALFIVFVSTVGSFGCGASR